ncbi:hypothetical protein TWF102_008277 [Orbilia oligospora]|uniref:Uncharacterized protein n=1 Tax=Orbilia oligospora TaxID=2813651 RepID=A0A7C8NJB4_ORBOL|nr:hypothetical protein TWF102_008277 [Orbilia oligospora]KAF3114427.1 hypothetical protein TWF706_008350 [Orbilia oligospora]KAF3269814.1 hypothetical protein TWF217_008176 [Orbilia oligospora]KAF3270266.1 hypothetical protein TWF128_004067 [Orbilia oligospora]
MVCAIDDEANASLPNLRRLFANARTEPEESSYSRSAFWNLILFASSIAVFSVAAQRLSGRITGGGGGGGR